MTSSLKPGDSIVDHVYKKKKTRQKKKGYTVKGDTNRKKTKEKYEVKNLKRKRTHAIIPYSLYSTLGKVYLLQTTMAVPACI